MGVLGAEAGDAIGGRGDSHRRPVAGRLDARAARHERVGDAPRAPQRVLDDGDAGVALRVDGEVLPTAPAAAGAARRARRRHAVRRRVDHLDGVTAGPVPLLRRQLGGHGLAGEGAAHEHDPPAVLTGDRLTAGREAVRAQRDDGHPFEATAGGHTAVGRLGSCGGRSQAVPSTPMARPIQIAPSVLPGRLRPPRRGGRGAREGRRRPHPVGRHGRPVRAEPDVRARRHRRRPLVGRHPVRGPPDGRSRPTCMAPRYVEAGCRRLIVHAEACPHLHRTLGAIRELGATAGVALNPATPPSAVAHVLDLVELILVMTVNPGWGGQQYIASMEPKIAEVRRMVTRGRARRHDRRRGRRRHRPGDRGGRPRRPAPTSSSPAARCTRTPRASSTPCSTCGRAPPRSPRREERGDADGRAALHADPQRLRERRHRRQRPRTAQRRRAGERPAGRVVRAAPPTRAAGAGVARGPAGRHRSGRADAAAARPHRRRAREPGRLVPRPVRRRARRRRGVGSRRGRHAQPDVRHGAGVRRAGGRAPAAGIARVRGDRRRGDRRLPRRPAPARARTRRAALRRRAHRGRRHGDADRPRPGARRRRRREGHGADEARRPAATPPTRRRRGPATTRS